jgi:hypothetical protein
MHSDLLEESQRLVERTGDAIGHSVHSIGRHKGRTGGIILLVLALVGLAWMWPEIQRYLKIERM